MAREIDRRNFLRVGKRTLDVDNGKVVDAEGSDADADETPE